MDMKRPPVWAVQYKRKYGRWPIAGGSSDATVTNGPGQPTGQPTGPAVDPASGFPDARQTAERGFGQGASDNGGGGDAGGVRTLPPRDPETGRFTKDDLEKARKEEKDKLYPRLQTLEEELRVLREEREARLRAEEEARKAAEEEEARRRTEEMSAKDLIQQKEREWQERFQALEREREAERAMLEKERQFSVLMEYRNRRIQDESEHIAPEFIDYIVGNDEQEIEESINRAKEKTARILEQVSQAGIVTRAGMRGASVTAPPVGPMENDSNQETLSPEQIRNMDMSTWQKKRQAVLGSLYQSVRERGLYG